MVLDDPDRFGPRPRITWGELMDLDVGTRDWLLERVERAVEEVRRKST